MRILTVVGNRPQFMKAAALSEALTGEVEQVLVHTGAHYDPEMSDVFFDELPLPDAYLRLETGSGTHAQQTAALLESIEPVVAELAPDAILVLGDTNTTMATSLVAAKSGVPLAHLEAGMRSFDRTMPEEVNRIIADRLAGLLLCSTRTAVENLEAEGRSDGRLVGDVMVDLAERLAPLAQERSGTLSRLGLEPGGYFLATAHRPANVDAPEALESLVAVLLGAAELAPLVLSLHPRTRARLDGSGLISRLNDSGVIVQPPLGYLDFAALMRSARAVLTDSGGLQKEAYVAAVPCVTLRESTEWVETVEAGWNRLVGLDPTAAVDALRDFERGSGLGAPDRQVYGSGDAAARVVRELAAWNA